MQQLSRHYPLWFVDIWGVVHNGVAPFAETVATLAAHRRNGGIVVLVSNSPRSQAGVTRQLDQLGVDRNAYDAAVTSGDVTQDLMRAVPSGKLFHIGPARDLSLFEGLPVSRVSEADADAIICTGLFNDDTETPADYANLLARLHARGLPLICANPDKLVRKGSTMLYCAGSLADAYQALGGEVRMAGKPYAPIYALALQTAATIARRSFGNQDILAIGDGPETDILGAARQGYPVVYVAGGVRDAVENLATEKAHIEGLVPTANILMAVHHLSWV